MGDKKKEIADFQAMSADDLAAKIEEKKAEIKTAESTFEEEVKKLQETYGQLQKDKDAAVAAVKASGLGLMQAVQACQEECRCEIRVVSTKALVAWLTVSIGGLEQNFDELEKLRVASV